jgi:hypothetical protein
LLKSYKKMKKILCVITLLLGISPCTLAQTHSDSASARANGVDRGSVRGVILGNERGVEAQPKTAAQLRRVLVNCNDGSRHIARVCRRHGGIARNQGAAR